MPIQKRKSTTKKKKETPRSSSSQKAITVQEAGRRGGQAVKEKYGAEFYSQIGQKGGEKVQAEAKRYKELKKAGKIKV